MSKEQKKVKGVVVSIFENTTTQSSEKGTNYDVQLDDNKDYIMWVKNGTDLPVAGDTIIMFSNDFGSYNFWKVETEEEAASFKKSQGAGQGKSYSGKKSYNGGSKSFSNNDYWESKYYYEVDEKDPRITRLAVFRDLVGLGIECTKAGIPLSGETAADVSDILNWASSTLDRAVSVINRISTSPNPEGNTASVDELIPAAPKRQPAAPKVAKVKVEKATEPANIDDLPF